MLFTENNQANQTNMIKQRVKTGNRHRQQVTVVFDTYHFVNNTLEDTTTHRALTKESTERSNRKHKAFLEGHGEQQNRSTTATETNDTTP